MMNSVRRAAALKLKLDNPNLTPKEIYDQVKLMKLKGKRKNA